EVSVGVALAGAARGGFPFHALDRRRRHIPPPSRSGRHLLPDLVDHGRATGTCDMVGDPEPVLERSKQPVLVVQTTIDRRVYERTHHGESDVAAAEARWLGVGVVRTLALALVVRDDDDSVGAER